jgi:protein ImuB
VAELAGLGLAATAGLARTPLLARYVAHTLADAAGAAAVRRLAPEAEAAFLAPLPLAVAEPPAELADVCALWGVRTLGDLLALPRDEVGRRFGAAGLALWQRAAGGAPRPLRLAALPVEFAARLRFEDGVATLEPLLFGLRRSLDRLALELRAAHFVAAALDLALHLEDGGRHTRTFSLPEPTADPAVLFRALHTHLETLQTAAALTGFDLAVVPARPPVRQAGLFETGLRDPHGFAETLARVSAIVGPGRLGTPQLLDTRRPDAVGLAAPAPTVPPPAPPPVHPPYGLPLRRFRPPLLATLEFAAGSRRPTYLFTHRFHGEIADLRGPWRSSGDWWQHDRAWIRCEWDLALAGGGLYRLLQVDDAYFIEGEYD